MKKFISILFVTVILFNAGGYFFGYLILRNEIHYTVQQKIKYEIKTNLSKNDLSLIIVTPENEDDILWIKAGKEFNYSGEMYDVVRTENKSQGKYYYCIKDTKEKQLIGNYIKMHRSGKNGKRLSKILNISYIPPSGNFTAFISFEKINRSGSASNLISTEIDIPFPPPKTA